MELCSLCERIKKIRIKQSKAYYYDLCDDCKRKEISKVFSHMRKRISSIS